MDAHLGELWAIIRVPKFLKSGRERKREGTGTEDSLAFDFSFLVAWLLISMPHHAIHDCQSIFNTV